MLDGLKTCHVTFLALPISHLDRLFCSGEKSNPQNFSVCCSTEVEHFKDSKGSTPAVSPNFVNSEDSILIHDGIEKTKLNSGSTAKDIRGQ